MPASYAHMCRELGLDTADASIRKDGGGGGYFSRMTFEGA